MTEIDNITLEQWARGRSPVDAAIHQTSILIAVRDSIAVSRSENPESFPLPVWTSTCPDSVARKLVAAMLNAGWTPPSPVTVVNELRKSATRVESLTEEELLSQLGPDADPGSLTQLRRGLAEQAELYRRRADELS